jgi:hypothetical protein
MHRAPLPTVMPARSSCSRISTERHAGLRAGMVKGGLRRGAALSWDANDHRQRLLSCCSSAPPERPKRPNWSEHSVGPSAGPLTRACSPAWCRLARQGSTLYPPAGGARRSEPRMQPRSGPRGRRGASGHRPTSRMLCSELGAWNKAPAILAGLLGSRGARAGGLAGEEEEEWALGGRGGASTVARDSADTPRPPPLQPCTPAPKTPSHAHVPGRWSLGHSARLLRARLVAGPDSSLSHCCASFTGWSYLKRFYVRGSNWHPKLHQKLHPKPEKGERAERRGLARTSHPQLFHGLSVAFLCARQLNKNSTHHMHRGSKAERLALSRGACRTLSSRTRCTRHNRRTGRRIRHNQRTGRTRTARTRPPRAAQAGSRHRPRPRAPREACGERGGAERGRRPLACGLGTHPSAAAWRRRRRGRRRRAWWRRIGPRR